MRAISFLFAVLISGCASVPSSYNPDDLQYQDLAHVKQYKPSWGEAQHRATIAAVYDDSKTMVIDSSFWAGEHASVSLVPGTYFFLFKCDNGSTYSFPRAKVELEESTEYTMFCERIIEEDALLGMDQIRGVMARVVKSSEFSPEIIKHKYFKKD